MRGGKSGGQARPALTPVLTVAPCRHYVEQTLTDRTLGYFLQKGPLGQLKAGGVALGRAHA